MFTIDDGTIPACGEWSQYCLSRELNFFSYFVLATREAEVGRSEMGLV